MHTLTQIFRNIRAAAATHLRCAVWVHSKELSTSVCSFVGNLIKEHSPSSIIDRLGEPSTCQAFEVQIFDRYQAIVRNNPLTDFVMKVASLIANMRVSALQELNSFAATMTAFLSSGYFALCLSESCLRFFEVARILYLKTFRERGKRRQSHIYADRCRADRQSNRIAFNRETGKPVSRFTLDSERFDFAFYGTMQLDFDFADFRQTQLRALNRKTKLRISETVIARARTKARKTCLRFALHTSKEGFEGLVNSLQGVLKDLRIDAVKLWAGLLDFNKLCRLRSKVDALVTAAPGVAAFLYGCIVQLATRAKGLLKNQHLSFAWIQPEFIGLAIRHLFDFQRIALSLPKARHLQSNRKLSLSIASAETNASRETLAAAILKIRPSIFSPADECQTAGQPQPLGERGQALFQARCSRLGVACIHRAGFLQALWQYCCARQSDDTSESKRHGTYSSTSRSCLTCSFSEPLAHYTASSYINYGLRKISVSPRLHGNSTERNSSPLMNQGAFFRSSGKKIRWNIS